MPEYVVLGRNFELKKKGRFSDTHTGRIIASRDAVYIVIWGSVSELMGGGVLSIFSIRNGRTVSGGSFSDGGKPSVRCWSGAGNANQRPSCQPFARVLNSLSRRLRIRYTAVG